MKTISILAALALSVNTASAGISTAISFDPKDNRVYAVFYEDEACQPKDAWNCAYLALVCFVPEKLIGGVIMHMPVQQIMDNYAAGKISVNGQRSQPIYMVRPGKDNDSWVMSFTSDKIGTANLIGSLPEAEAIDIDMGDYHRSLRLNGADQGNLSSMVDACNK